MSLIIKGMKMPDKAGDYDARLHVNRDGTALFYLYKECGGYAAKEIPPHGRLIDADALISKAPNVRVFDYKVDVIEEGYSENMIQKEPTIIEAEEEKK